MIRAVLFTLLFPLLIFSQNNNDRRFSTQKATALSGTAEVLTVQHAASTNKTVQFLSGYIYCSAVCTVTLEHGGTVASSTANTIVNLNPNNSHAATTTSQAYYSSNVGTGTVINIYNLPAGSFASIDLNNFILPGGILDNLTLRTNAITASVQLQLTWLEL